MRFPRPAPPSGLVLLSLFGTGRGMLQPPASAPGSCEPLLRLRGQFFWLCFQFNQV